MFELEQEIQNWCDELRTQRGFNRAQIEELRDHLEQEISKQQALGVDEEKAFYSAVDKLGNTKDIAQEFLKIQFSTQLIQFFTESVYVRKIVALFLIFGAWEMLLKLSFMVVTGYNRQVAIVAIIVLIPIIIWTRHSGVALWKGQSVNYTGLLLFYLIQVPVFGLASFNYEFYYGLSLLAEFGYIESLFDFAFLGNQHRSLIDVTLSGNFHLNAPFDSPWYRGSYFAINLYALFASIFSLCNLIKQHREIPSDELLIINDISPNSTDRRGLIKQPIKTFKWLPY